MPGMIWSSTLIRRAAGLRFGHGLDRWTPSETLFIVEVINPWTEKQAK